MKQKSIKDLEKEVEELHKIIAQAREITCHWSCTGVVIPWKVQEFNSESRRDNIDKRLYGEKKRNITTGEAQDIEKWLYEFRLGISQAHRGHDVDGTLRFSSCMADKWIESIDNLIGPGL